MYRCSLIKINDFLKWLFTVQIFARFFTWELTDDIPLLWPLPKREQLICDMKKPREISKCEYPLIENIHFEKNTPVKVNKVYSEIVCRLKSLLKNNFQL